MATPADEHKWCNVAEYTTAAQLSRLTAAARKVTGRDAAHQIERRGLTWTTESDGSITITLRVPADQAVAVLAAVKAAVVPVKGVPWAQSAADTLVDLVIADRDVRTEVIHHVDDTGSHAEDGPPVAPHVTDCAGCDGAVTTVVGTPDGPIEIDKQAAPTRRQRRMIHRHGLLLTLHPNRTLTITDRHHTPVDRPLPDLDFDIEPPTRPDLIGHWLGDTMNVNDCLAAVGIC